MQPTIVSSTYRVNELHYTFGCGTLGPAYICNPSIHNYRFLPYVWLRRLWVQPMFLSPTYKISVLHNTYKIATLTLVFDCTPSQS